MSLEAADRLAVLAHEVRSPVAALTAIAEAYPAADDVSRQRLLELAGAAVVSLERLLGDAAPASLRLVRVDVGRLAVDAAEVATLGGARVVADAGDGLETHGDPDRLRQALDNLIANAVGHSPAGGTVTVTAQREGESVVVAVADKGGGIALDDLDRVFEPGVRLTAARPGSGLGLAVVRTIARAHGGEVEVESSPGQGATFRLVLPGASGAG
jgi:two-component system sensor histidine kinase BaeS